MTSSATDIPWRKAIPQSRDRLQSRILLWIVVPLLLALSAQAIRIGMVDGDSLRVFLGKAVAIGVVFGISAYFVRAATPAAASTGSLVCFLLITWTGSSAKPPWHSALAPLMALFVLTFVATKLGRKRKTERGLAESRKGRTAAQVIANLGVAALLSSPAGNFLIIRASQDPRVSSENFWSAWYIVILAALAEATSDTVSSEIGQAFGATPILLTTLRRVAPGTDGAITLLGIIAGIAAAALIAIIGVPAMGMSVAECAIAFAAGVAGLFFDSLLGATIEARGWIGNDLVNFFSTAFAAAVSLAAIRFAQPLLLR